MDAGETAHKDQYSSLVGVNTASSGLSIAGCVVILVLFIVFPDLRKHFSRLVVYLSISDFWFCFSNLIGHFEAPTSGCTVQGSLSTFFGLSSILWTWAIAYSLRKVIELGPNFDERELEAFYQKFCWGIPTAMTLLCVITVQYEPAGFWCWVDGSFYGEVLRMLVFYGPLWAVIFYNIVGYRRMLRTLDNVLEVDAMNSVSRADLSAFQEASTLADQKAALRRLLAFPMILVFCWTAGSIKRLVTLFYPSFSLHSLDLLIVLTGSLQGFLNALIYGSTVAVREKCADATYHCVAKFRTRAKRWRRSNSIRGRFSSTRGSHVKLRGGESHVSDAVPDVIGAPALNGSPSQDLSARRDTDASDDFGEFRATAVFDDDV